MSMNIVVVLILLISALGIAEARTPQVGDSVYIIVGGGSTLGGFTGEITFIGDGLICIFGNPVGSTTPAQDICIGTGSIYELSWT